MSKSQPIQHHWTRYLWTGAGLGLYFGLFFRPARELNVPFAVALGLLAGLVMTLFRVWRGERPSFGAGLKLLGGNMVKFVLLLLVLEARHPVYDWGGRLAVSVMTTIMGAISGAWYGHQERKQRP